VDADDLARKNRGRRINGMRLAVIAFSGLLAVGCLPADNDMKTRTTTLAKPAPTAPAKPLPPSVPQTVPEDLTFSGEVSGRLRGHLIQIREGSS
jgi:hypothetical protein